MGGLQRRIGVVGQPVKQREIGQHRQQAAGHDDLLAPDLVRQRAEHDEKRRADQQRGGDHQVGRGRVDLERLRQEKQRIELAAVPHHGLAGRSTQQRQHHDLGIAQPSERLRQRRLGGASGLLHPREGGRFVQAQPDPHRDDQQEKRQQERQPPPAAVGERVFPDPGAGAQDHQQRHEKAHRGGGLDPGREVAAPAVRRVLGHVGGRSPVLTAQRQALQQPQRDQDHGSGDAPGRVTGQQSDQEGRRSHDRDRDQERVLAAHDVPDPAEDHRPERAHREAGRKGQQRHDELRGGRQRSEELLAHDGRQRAEYVEVVPLEHRAQRRGEDDFAFFRRHRSPADVRRLLCDAARCYAHWWSPRFSRIEGLDMLGADPVDRLIVRPRAWPLEQSSRRGGRRKGAARQYRRHT